jgi:hypothetical protein
VRVEDRHLRVALERAVPGEAVIEDARERVLVAAPVERLAFDLLRRRVVDGADELPGLGLAGNRRAALGEPEVGEEGMVPSASVNGQQDVARLDVAMYEGLLVRGVQCVRHLGQDSHGPLWLEWPVGLDGVLEGGAGDVSHRDEQNAVRLTGLVDGDDVGVVE